MLTLTSQHALKALIHLVRNGDAAPISGPQIARQMNIPARYLSAILSGLVRTGILDSAPGKHGGFRLVKAPRQVSLYDAVEAFEPGFTATERCPFGNDECSDANPCCAHDQWKKVIEAERKFLRRMTLHDVAAERGASARKKKRKAKS